jgi:hypothetical protein
LLVLASCDCAELALVHVPDGEDRPRRAIETARAWAGGGGNVSLDDVRQAANAAYAAADAAYAAYAAAYAANAAYAAAAYAAYASAYAAADAANAATAAAYAAYAAADAAYAADARDETLARCAVLVRKRIPWAVVAAAIEEKGL